MSQICRGFRAALQNLLPSSRFLCKKAASTYVGPPTATDWLKKSNVAPPFLLNRNGITNNPARPPFLPSSSSSSSSSSLHSATYSSKDKKGEDDLYKKLSKEKVKILRVLLDYDDPQNHLIDTLEIMSKVLDAWGNYHPDFDFTDGFRDIKTARNLLSHHGLYTVFKEDEKATSKNISRSKRKILKLLLDYDNPRFADLILLLAMRFWKCIISDCINAWSMNNDKDDDDDEVKNTIPLNVTWRLKAYKRMMNNYDDPDDMIKVISVLALKEEEMKRRKEEEEWSSDPFGLFQ